MDTKALERNIKTIIKTGSGYGPDFQHILRDTKNILKRINKGRATAENFFQLGSLCLKLEDESMALEAFQTGFNLNQKHVNCGTYLALLLEQHDRINDALTVYKLLNHVDPDNIHIVERMLFICYQQNDIKTVLILCHYFLEKKLYYAVIYDYIAKVYYDSGNYTKAIEHLQNALLLDKNKTEYTNRLIHHLYKDKQYDSVLQYEDYLAETQAVSILIRLLMANESFDESAL